jgi:uncharacterized RDD family membrane protein YckC
MRAWVIIDGEKAGPFDIAQVARKIEAGEYTAEMHGWIEGMRQWQPLSSMPQFTECFTRVPAAADEPIMPPPLPVRHPLSPATWQLPASTLQERTAMLVRRLFARWFDLILWSSLFVCVMHFAGANLKDMLTNYWSTYLMMLVWILLEAAMIHVWGCTPGKYLLGLRVSRMTGTPLPVGLSLLRAVRVYLMGMGMSNPLLMPLCHWFSWWFVRKHGAALWDGASGIRVSLMPITPLRWVWYVLLLISIINLNRLILEPVSREVFREMFPEQAKWLESQQEPHPSPTP